MPKIVARFYVQAFTKKAGEVAEVVLQAASSKENARWSQYTPAGQIAIEALVGQECLVTFDFDVEKGEAPEYRREGTPDQLGYVSDEEQAAAASE